MTSSCPHPGFVLVEEHHVAVLALDVADAQVLGVDVATEVVWLHEAVSAVLAQVGPAVKKKGDFDFIGRVSNSQKG